MNTFNTCQNLAKLYGFGDICEKLQSDPCSIFSNGSHVFWQIKNLNTTFVQDTLRNICAKFHIIPLSSFRGEDFWKILNGRQQTPSDGNSSHGLWPVELKIPSTTTFYKLILKLISAQVISLHLIFYSFYINNVFPTHPYFVILHTLHVDFKW